MTNIARLHASDIATGNIVQADPLNNELNQLVVAVNDKDDRVAAIESGNVTIGGNKTFSGTLTASDATGVTTNTITERTAASGVTIDSVLCKDGMVTVAGTPTGAGQIGYASNNLTHHNGTAVATIDTSLNQGYILLQGSYASGTNGGTYTAGANRTLPITTKVDDTLGVCTLASNQITLAAGTYDLRAWSVGNDVNGHQIFWVNITDATTVASGSCVYSSTSTVGTAHLHTRFTIAAPKVFELQGRCGKTRATDGMGFALSFGTEVYRSIEIRKVA
jgi:hypothetical protein